MGGRGGSQENDEVLYPSYPHHAAHPDRLALLGRLHGLDTPDPGSATFVDLACGDGSNVLAVAAALPGARCIGVDANEAAIARARLLRDASGLQGVDLQCADLREDELPERLGRADYVAIHGVLSWVDADVRDAALSIAARILAPGGVLVVSYNALPGWHLLQPARSLALRHLRTAASDPAERAETVRKAARQALELHAVDDAYGRALALALERYEREDPRFLHFDDFAEMSRPFSLTEVAEAAGRHRLTYLEEALPDQWWRWRLGPTSLRILHQAAGDDPVSLQQEADFASGALFKATAFVRDGAVAAPEMKLDSVAGLYAVAASDPPAPRPDQAPAVLTVAAELERMAPRAVRVDELVSLTGLKRETGAGAALRLMAERRAMLHVRAPRFAHPAGSHPRASSLARAQAEQGLRVASLRHESAEFDEPLGRGLLQLLDGTRDRGMLAAELASLALEINDAHVAPTQIEAALDSYLDSVSRLALLVPE